MQHTIKNTRVKKTHPQQEVCTTSFASQTYLTQKAISCQLCGNAW